MTRVPLLIQTLILLYSLLLAASSTAQTLPNRRYTTADGLAADRITCATQDDKGFMWIGTYFGLSRYDGYRLTTIPLPPVQQNKYVAAITAAHGNVYAGFWFGGGLMEYSNGKVKSYELPEIPNRLNNITALSPHNKKGVIAAGGISSVYHFAEGKFSHLFTFGGSLENQNATALCMDSTGNIWAGTPNGLFIHLADGSNVIGLKGRHILYIRQTKNGVVVVSSKGNNCEVVKFTPAHAFWQTEMIWQSETMLAIPQNSFHSDNLWLTDSAGTFHHLTASGSHSAFTSEGISKEDLHFLYADRENNLWIATHTGIVKMANLPARSFAFSEKAYGTGDIAGNDSLLWITNSEQLYNFKEGRFNKVPEFRDKNNLQKLGRLVQQEQSLWVSLENSGVFRLQLRKDKIISKEYFHAFNNVPIWVHSMVEDSKGNVWIGGRNGIFFINDGKPVAHCKPVFTDGTPLFIIALAIDAENNIIWAGDNESGVYKLRYNIAGNTIQYKILTRIDGAKGLTDGHIRSLLLDSTGTLWCGTRFGGIFRIWQQQNKLHVQNLTAKAQLRCARITDIREKDDAIWLATCGGVYRYMRNTDQWQAFTAANGLMDSEVFTNYISPSTKHCWAVSTSGVTALQYDKPATVAAPLINITAITVLGKTDTAALFSNKAPSWSADESSIGFQFAGATFSDEKRIWYKYMLEGHDKTWSDATQANSVNYVSLPPGDYVFKVLASAGIDRWSNAPATFSFTVVRPFYKSPLFIILMLCAAFTGFYFFRMYQLQQRLKLERMRSRISADLHDDIGSTLSSISIISEGVLQEQDPVASKQMIREISDNAMQLMDKMDDIIWCVSPQNDSFQQLMLRIRKFAAAVFEARGIDYDIVIDQHIGKASLPMEHRQHLYLILKEAINNLVKYSSATYAGINITMQGSLLVITVTDNGKGFNVQAQQHGNGLRNMQRRASLMKAKLTIESDAGGTRIHVGSKIK